MCCAVVCCALGKRVQPSKEEASDETPTEEEQELVQELVYNGISKEDAVVAVHKCEGDVEAALIYAIECLGRGGAAKVQVWASPAQSVGVHAYTTGWELTS
jgi:hypothetical protein